MCEGCKAWFTDEATGITEEEAKNFHKWYCEPCVAHGHQSVTIADVMFTRDWVQVTHPVTWAPQVGDVFYYFRKGHERYLAEHPDLGDAGRPTPYQRLHRLEHKYQCQVSEIEYEFHGDDVIMVLTIVMLRAKLEHTYKIAYRPSAVAPDFLVHTEVFKEAMRKDWEVGEAVKVHAKGKWRSGAEILNMDEDREAWGAYQVRLEENQDLMEVGAWDLMKTTDHGMEMSELLPKLMEAQVDELAALITKAEENRAFAAFCDPMEGYSAQIPCPLCLSLIKERLLGGYYRSQDAYRHDVTLMYSNSKRFYRESQEGPALVRACKRVMDKLLSARP